jgi:hypothetical protein
MKIRIDFDPTDIERQRAREAQDLPLAFSIWIEHNGQAFPSAGWRDFGAVLLGWWSYRLWQLLNGTPTTTLDFMNGPYEVEVRYHRSTQTIELQPLERTSTGTEAHPTIKWGVGQLELVTALLQAMRRVIAELEQRNMGRKDRELLTQRVEMLAELTLA